MEKVDNIEQLFEDLPDEKKKLIHWMLYGKPVTPIDIPQSASDLSSKHNFEIKAFKFSAQSEQVRTPHLVRFAVAQHSIVRPTTDPFDVQYHAIEDKMRHIIDAAGLLKVNILCLQEAWTMPFAFCTREKHWCQYAESPNDGPSIKFIKEMAIKHNMVIIAPILERDEAHGETVWNTAVVVGNRGNVIGKHRKRHIPRVGDYNESTYYFEGNDGNPVFQTEFGKIGINICYGRHHPLHWLMYGINGAQIVFNPSATTATHSEPMWSVEARNAAITNSYFVACTNRVGTENFEHEFTSGDGQPAHKDFGWFYGSAYVSAPDGSRTPSLTRLRDGLMVSEADLNLCRQMKDKWGFQMTSRMDEYASLLGEAVKEGFKPQVVVDPTLPK